MSKSIFSTQKIAIMGMLTALMVVVNVFSIQVTPSIAISFVQTIALIAGLTLGPYFAFIVGFLGSCIGFFINPLGAYNVLFDIATGLIGFIFGYAFIFYRKVIKNKSPIKFIITLLIAYILVTIICTAGINTVACYVLYSNGTKTFFVYLFGRLPFQLISTGINVIISSILTLALNKVELFNKIFNID